ncbi:MULTISPECIES: DNA polymerase III subunit gamma and tau [unclassified Gordonia (in: high G+C Gram-positive bacteria)]|uniref:DNA polymerase III subunit gamma and tau n=1 Tax=unclassified Gordonia (in: high G+C Gram-positive bacteria) TaxID=2657482 RepID=UPI00071C6D37|nr:MULTISPECIES: DNA polymerase III subunit gamma and tau [unclassified Gordonia (in: high G+C Gram-positive bacteria)]SCC10012.1 DNA polymerase-3 subunit gamma/tau [Gordonia sp. v-85]
MALYRTYRPATFADVVGQEHVTDPLSRALDSGRINHAYLFSGPRGCGKTSSARILARSLNCVQGPTSTPCGTCVSCVALAPGGPGNLDVIELDAASHGGVDDTRELRDRAFYAPAESRYRVFIVDEAHMVTNAGFNALLKIVEEPPEHLIFVFATTEPEKVLPTIRSRTHHYPFRLLAPPVMRGLLETICEREGVTVASEVYPLVIRAGGGSPRDSLSILDQLLAGADDQGVAYERALALLGVTDVALIDTAVDALADADGSALFGTVEKVVDAGHDPRRFAVDLLERLRDLILLQAVPDAADRGLVEAPGDQLARMRAQIETLGPASLTRFAEIVHNALGEMRGTTSPRLLLEVMCARMLLPAVSDDDAALLQRLERLESGIGTTSIPVPAKPAEPEPEPKFVRPSQRKAMEEAKAAEASERAAAEAVEADAAQPDTGRVPKPVVPEPVVSEPVAPEMVVETPAPEPVIAEAVAAGAAPEAVHPDSTGVATGSEVEAEAGAVLPAEEPADDESMFDELIADQPNAEAAAVEPATDPAPVADASSDDETASLIEVPAPPTPTQPPARSDRTPSAPEPPSRHRDASSPEPEPIAEPASNAPYDDIPLPDEPVDEDDVPPPDAMPVRARRPEPEPVPEPEPEPEAPVGLDADSVRKRYQDIRAAVRERSKSLEPMLSAAVIADVDGTTVVLSHPVEVLVGRLSAPHAVTIIREALTEVFGTELDVRTVHQAPGAAAPSATSTAPPSKQAAKARQSYSRPSRARDQSATPVPAPEPVAEPEEPEPPRADEDIPHDERAEMVADARTGSPEQRLDPDQVALELLKSELGARPLE